MFKAAVFAYSVAMAINFGRIYRLMLADPDYFKTMVFFVFKIVKERVLFMTLLWIWVSPVDFNGKFRYHPYARGKMAV